MKDAFTPRIHGVWLDFTGLYPTYSRSQGYRFWPLPHVFTESSKRLFAFTPRIHGVLIENYAFTPRIHGGVPRKVKP